MRMELTRSSKAAVDAKNVDSTILEPLFDKHDTALRTILLLHNRLLLSSLSRLYTPLSRESCEQIALSSVCGERLHCITHCFGLLPRVTLTRVSLLRYSKQTSLRPPDGWAASTGLLLWIRILDHRWASIDWCWSRICFLCGWGIKIACAQHSIPKTVHGLCSLTSRLPRANLLWHVCTISQPRPDPRPPEDFLQGSRPPLFARMQSRYRFELLLKSPGGRVVGWLVFCILLAYGGRDLWKTC